MLIFILPSSLYLKITNQDGDKGTQRIWVCLMPATLIFLISFSISICQINSQSPPCDTTFNGLEGRQQSVLQFSPLGDVKFLTRIYSLGIYSLPCSLRISFQVLLLWFLSVCSELGQGRLGNWMLIVLVCIRRWLIFSKRK